MEPDVGHPRDRATRVSKLNKSCDQCRHRKVRCVLPPGLVGSPSTRVCTHCLKRNEVCSFSITQRRFLRTESAAEPTATLCGPDPANGTCQERLAHGLFIDRLLEDPASKAVLYDEFSILKAHEHRVTSSGLAFFSERKVELLTRRIGNSRLRHLIAGIDTVLQSNLLKRTDAEISQSSLSSRPQTVEVSPDEATAYIKEYFDHVHPSFPFLDRVVFERNVRDAHLTSTLNLSPQLSTLYHAVLALGCQRRGGGSFVPGKGKAWHIFLVAVTHVADKEHFGDSLTSLQALIAMSIFALSPCYLQVDHTILAEATQMALRLRYHTSTIDENQEDCHRTFWVLYCLDKYDSFQARRASVICDYDIGCPVPQVTAYPPVEYNWFLSSIRLARIRSVAYETLFSVSASVRPAATQMKALGNVRACLEKWRVSVPVDLRPLEPLKSTYLVDPKTKQVALLTQYGYYHLVIAIERLGIRLSSDQGTLLEQCQSRLVEVAKKTIELTRFIDVETFTPIFILGIMPLSALFILFDVVITSPYHADTREKLTLLDIASGHFSQLEHVSAGSLPGNHLSEFAHIARNYIQELRAPPSIAGPSVRQARPTQGITQAGVSLDTSTVGDTALSSHEVSSVVDDIDCTEFGTDFDASTWFDDLGRTADFLSDGDISALFGPLFQTM